MNPDWLTAFDALYKVYFDGAFSNLAVNDAVRARSGCDAPFVRTFVKGTIARTVTLDYYIGRLVKRGVRGVKRRPLTVLRMGLYAIEYLDSVPDYAAVDLAVTLAGTVCKGEKGFVNAVLRSFLREKDRITDLSDISDETRRLYIQYGFPEPLVAMLAEQYGPDDAAKLMDGLNRPPALCIRVNTLKCSRDELIRLLQDAGFSAVPDPDTARGVYIAGGEVVGSQLYKDGYFTVQSSSSIRSIEALSPTPGAAVLDMCAAPGGKTAMMAEMMGDTGSVTACDIHEHRLGLIRATADRLGLTAIEPVLRDGTAYEDALRGAFDFVLCDVPCSGLGVISTKPEFRLTFDSASSDELSDLQFRILSNGYAYTKPGGRIMYSTCTINKAENERVTERFLLSEPGAHVVEKELCFPYNNKVGFYFCLIQKPDEQ